MSNLATRERLRQSTSQLPASWDNDPALPVRCIHYVRCDLADRGAASNLDFSGYEHDRVEIQECTYTCKTFTEVYLQDNHVEPFHPGLGQFVTCDNLVWQFGDRYSLQT